MLVIALSILCAYFIGLGFSYDMGFKQGIKEAREKDEAKSKKN